MRLTHIVFFMCYVIREKIQDQNGSCIDWPTLDETISAAAASSVAAPEKPVSINAAATGLPNLDGDKGKKAENMSRHDGEMVPRAVPAGSTYDGDVSMTQHRQPQTGHKVITAAWSAIKESVRLFTTTRILLLSATSMYTGLVISFYGGVFSTSVGFTLAFKNSRSLVGLVGIFVGLGAVTSGFLFGILGKITRSKGKRGRRTFSIALQSSVGGLKLTIIPIILL